MYICICMYVCMYVFLCIYLYVYMYICIYVYVCFCRLYQAGAVTIPVFVINLAPNFVLFVPTLAEIEVAEIELKTLQQHDLIRARHQFEK